MDRRYTVWSVQGIGVLRERLKNRLLFMLSECFNVLSANRLTGLRGTNTPRISLLCRASEPKHEMDCDVRPGSVLAL